MNQWGLEKSHWRKHWQWFEIHRNLAQVVADDDIVRPSPLCPFHPVLTCLVPAAAAVAAAACHSRAWQGNFT